MTTIPNDDSITVIKVGGANLERPEFIDELVTYFGNLRARGVRVVMVHGGGGEIGQLHEDLGEPIEKIDGLRVTSSRGMEITTMVLAGLVNKRVVARLVSEDLPAIGLSGIDLGILQTVARDRDRLGFVGSAPQVNAVRLRALLEAGMLPVIAPVSLGPDGEALNVNADEAAHAIARALGAHSLEFVSDVPGIRIEKDSDAVAREIRSAEIDRLLSESDVITGGMIPKLSSAAEAVRAGVGRVRVGDLPAMLEDSATELVA